MRDPDLLIVDIGEFVREQYYTQLVGQLQPYLTIHDLIKLALTFNQYVGDGDAFWHLLEEKAGDAISFMNTEILQICMEGFTLELDAFIRRKTPPDIDTSFFVFHQWLPPTSLVLRNEKDKTIIYIDREFKQVGVSEYMPVRDYSSYRPGSW